METPPAHDPTSPPSGDGGTSDGAPSHGPSASRGGPDARSGRGEHSGGSPWRSAGVAAAGGAGAYLLSLLLALAPGIVDAVYGRAVGPAVAWLLSRLTGPAPFPVGQAAAVAYLAWLSWLAAKGARDAFRSPAPPSGATAPSGRPDASAGSGDADAPADQPDGSAAGGGGRPRTSDRREPRRSRLRALGLCLSRGGARLVRHGGVLLASFYLLWGFQYARPSLEARMGLPDGRGAERAELVSLAERAVAATNRAYRAIHDTVDAGEPTRVSVGREALKRDLEAGWREAADEAGLPGHYGWSYGPVKAFVPDGFLVKVGLGGFYFPWTGEAVVDAGTPASDLVQSIAHEQAHQRGVAPEDEASFMGFLAASRAPNAVARYSALLFAQLHLVAAAASGGRPEIRERLTGERLPGVSRDVEDLYAYWRRRIRAAVEVTRRVNDAYLKSNRVEGGVASYGLVTRLLVAQARADGERLFPEGGEGAPRDARGAVSGPEGGPAGDGGADVGAGGDDGGEGGSGATERDGGGS